MGACLHNRARRGAARYGSGPTFRSACAGGVCGFRPGLYGGGPRTGEGSMGLMSRRYLLATATASAALAVSGRAVRAATTSNAGALPARGTFVIRNAYVMTMDDAGDIANGDVHVANGAII